MKFFLDGVWQERDEKIEVLNPGSGETIDTVPVASPADVETALAAAAKAKADIATLTGYQRFQVLQRASQLLKTRRETIAHTLSSEEGKPIREALSEVDRSVQTLELSGEEAKRLSGEVLPLDGGAGVHDKFGFTMRVPCGVVVAITPFNFPLNLVCHKIGPAIAAGNSVILKPASDTPLVALQLVEILLEAGLPENAINCITGSGGAIGKQLCSDERVRKISFTGSADVGASICHYAGIKRVTMELGSNSPMLVLPDADLATVAKAAAFSGFANAGQVCISAQRLIVDKKVHDDFVTALLEQVANIRTGDQLSEDTDMGPMVRESDAARVQNWIEKAVAEGAGLAIGGSREGALLEPSVIVDATEHMDIVKQEAFGPVVAVSQVAGIEEAIAMANNSPYGLSAAIFTKDIDHAMRFAQQVESGNIHINSGPMWRTDCMPYGGLKFSGIGREGPKYTVDEMSEFKTVVIHGNS